MAKTAGVLTSLNNIAGVNNTDTADFIPTVGDMLVILTGARFSADPNRPTLTVVDSSVGVDGFTVDAVTQRGSHGLTSSSVVREISIDTAIVTGHLGTGSGHIHLDFGGQTQLSILAKVFRITPSAGGALTVVEYVGGGRGTDDTIDENDLTGMNDAANATLHLVGYQNDSQTIAADGSMVIVGSRTNSGNSGAFTIAGFFLDSGIVDPSATTSGTSNHVGAVLEINEAVSGYIPTRINRPTKKQISMYGHTPMIRK